MYLLKTNWNSRNMTQGDRILRNRTNATNLTSTTNIDDICGSETASSTKSDGSVYNIEETADFSKEDILRERYNNRNHNRADQRPVNGIPFINSNSVDDYDKINEHLGCPMTNLPLNFPQNPVSWDYASLYNESVNTRHTSTYKCVIVFRKATRAH